MLSVLITKKKNPQKKLVYNTITTTQALNIPIASSFFWVWRGVFGVCISLESVLWVYAYI